MLSLHKFFKRKPSSSSSSSTSSPEAQMSFQEALEQLGQASKQQWQRKAGPGRPRKPTDFSRDRPKAGQKRLRTEMPAATKLRVVEELTQLRQRQEIGIVAALKFQARRLGCTVQHLRRICKMKEEIETFVAKRQTGLESHRGKGSRAKGDQRQSAGKRMPGERGYLGRPDYAREMVQETGQWAVLEIQQGHTISKGDLLRYFLALLEKASATARELIEEGRLCPEGQKRHKALSQKIKMIENSGKSRWRQADYLIRKTGLTERMTTRATTLSKMTEQERLESSWRYYDWLLSMAARADPAELQSFVADPVLWQRHKKHTALLFSDQIPIWLKPEQSKVLQIKATDQLARRLRDERKNLAKKSEQRSKENPEDGQEDIQAALREIDHTAPETTTRGPGDTGAARWRAGAPSSRQHAACSMQHAACSSLG